MNKLFYTIHIYCFHYNLTNFVNHRNIFLSVKEGRDLGAMVRFEGKTCSEPSDFTGAYWDKI